MELDLARFREKLLTRRGQLLVEDQMSEGDRAPVTLEQDSVGRLSRIDAMQDWTCNGFAPVTDLIMPPLLRTPAG